MPPQGDNLDNNQGWHRVSSTLGWYWMKKARYFFGFAGYLSDLRSLVDIFLFPRKAIGATLPSFAGTGDGMVLTEAVPGDDNEDPPLVDEGLIRVEGEDAVGVLPRQDEVGALRAEEL